MATDAEHAADLERRILDKLGPLETGPDPELERVCQEGAAAVPAIPHIVETEITCAHCTKRLRVEIKITPL